MNIYDRSKLLGSTLYNKGFHIATAESCTGGWLAQALTAMPGSSQWFLQGWVTYSNQSKTQQLDVPAELIIKYGAVSEPVAQAMAAGALLKSGADVALATTGVAGPDGGSKVNPIGTVWIAIAMNNEQVITERLNLEGDRTSIREQTVDIVFEKLINMLEQ